MTTHTSLTDSELLVLGLVAEMPRHGYALEQVINERGLREWTRIGFSSIYFVLGKLEKKGLVEAETPRGTKARKVFTMTSAGREALINKTLAALQTFRPSFPPFLIGMMHWPVLAREQALAALKARQQAVATELEKVAHLHFSQQPLPDYVDVIFEYSIDQLHAEQVWLTKTLAYMETKHWEHD